jgi:hypothetical protein
VHEDQWNAPGPIGSERVEPILTGLKRAREVAAQLEGPDRCALELEGQRGARVVLERYLLPPQIDGGLREVREDRQASGDLSRGDGAARMLDAELNVSSVLIG